jgi:hypothetical protein
MITKWFKVEVRWLDLTVSVLWFRDSEEWIVKMIMEYYKGNPNVSKAELTTEFIGGA